MKSFVEFCNANTGFFSLLVTIVSTIVAVATAIYTARVPYKRCLRVNLSFINFLSSISLDVLGLSNDQTYGVSVQATNLGRSDIFVTSVCLVLQNKFLHDPKHDHHLFSVPLNDAFRSQFKDSGNVKPGQSVSQYYPSGELLRLLEKKDAKYIVARAQDGLGKYYYGRRQKAQKLYASVKKGLEEHIERRHPQS